MGDTLNNGLIGVDAGVALAPEPLPVKNEQPYIQDLVLLDLQRTSNWYASVVEKDIRERKEFGIKKYGTGLQAFNGRNPVVDTYQEVLDGVVYARQAMAETEEKSVGWYDRKQVYDKLLDLAFYLSKLLRQQK